ncbi:MAG: hypothetical protein N4A76_01430 [Firmicutes bacterium]|nr:hypothetical protein [Bacillota bacterium]
MGDGRYYTDQQFFSVITITMLIIFIVFSITTIFYHSRNSKMNKGIFLSYLLLLMCSVLKFYVLVVVSANKAYITSLISALFLGQACIIFLYVLSDSFFRKSSTSGSTSGNRFLFIALVSISVFGVFFGESHVIISHTFFAYTYHIYYRIFLFLIAVLYFLLALKVLFMKLEDREYNTKTISLIMTIFIVLPLILFLVNINGKYSVIFYYVLIFSLSGCHNFFSNYFSEYTVNSYVFDDIKDMILDYVFITDEKGDILYKNTVLDKSEFFNNVSEINVDNITGIFNKEVEIREAFGKEFIVYNSEDKKYLQYLIKELRNKSNHAGYIITFSDISELILKLDELDKKEKTLKKINLDLKSHRSIVYDIEKEKEVNTLLKEIADNQYVSMKKLRSSILKLNLDDDSNILDHLDKLLHEARNDLSEVRSAVSGYRSYYEDSNH